MMRWPVIGTLAVAGRAAFWVVATPIPELQEQLRVSQFWVLEALGVALIVTTIAGLAQIRAAISRHDRYLAAGLCAVTFATVLIAPRTNRIFYDEQIYQGIARNLSDLHLAQSCNDGTVGDGHLQCRRHEYHKQPFGYPYALSLGYRLAGASDDVAHWMNVLAAAATAGVLFLLTLLITDNRLSAGLVAFSFALIPEQLRWSHTAASEPSAAFLCALAVLAAAAFVRARSTTTLIWAACASSFAAYMRPEAVLIVPVTALAILVGAANEARHVRTWWVAALCLVLLVPEIAHMAAVRNQDWGASDQRFSFAYFANNLVTNGRFYLADHRFPAVLTLLAIAGVSRSRWTLVMVVWFLLFWGVFLFFYAGSYDYGADVRYSLMSYAPLAVLAGTGAGRIAAALQRMYPALTWAGLGIGGVVAVPINAVPPMGPCCRGRSLGRTGRRGVCESRRARSAGQRGRADAQSKYVSRLGNQRRPAFHCRAGAGVCPARTGATPRWRRVPSLELLVQRHRSSAGALLRRCTGALRRQCGSRASRP
jgi:hypothetical protein